MKRPTIRDMEAFMVALPPSEQITQEVIRGAMERFGIPERGANRLYRDARAAGRIEQAIAYRQARAYQGATQGCFCVRTGYYYWRYRETSDVQSD